MLSRFARATSSAVRANRSMATLETLAFDNRALKKLPLDEEKDNYVRSVPGACYSRVDPTPVKAPELVALSDEALGLLDLSPSEVERAEFVEYFGGCRVLPGSEPAAHCYCGHQFGHFSGQLGDGCAMYLGEVTNGRGERWEVQLKGSGKTPYSRHADGRKVLRSSIREFLCSEAMHHLGVPTTRAGSCVTSDSYVQRDLLYNGNVINERCTIISRIAPSFIRFGSFEIFKPRDQTTGRAGPSVGRVDVLHQLLDYVTESYYPEIHSNHSDDRVRRTGALFKEVCSLTAKLVALWQCVGFCHGVLNTDNMSIVGVTIDYGPFGFLDRYDPGHICNGSDDGGRYSYKNQPSICRWNLSKLAEAFSVCLSPEDTKEGLQIYDEVFQESFLKKMREKIGLVRVTQPEDSDLVESFLETMQITGCDFTNGFRNLNTLDLGKLNDRRHFEESVSKMVEQCCAPHELVKSYKPGMPPHQLEMFLALQQQSPMLLTQLGISPEFLKREQDKIKEMEKVKKTSPEEKKRLDLEHWTSWMETYRSRLQHEVAGLSPAELKQAQDERLKTMNNNNPRFILRNHIAQKAIQLAEDGDYTEVRRVLHLLKHPFSEDIEVDGELWRDTVEPEATTSPEGATAVAGGQLTSIMKTYTSRPPDWALGLCVT